MRNAEGTILYVGKAKNLRNRARSYFTRDRDAKTTVLMKQVASVEHVVCRNEYDALLLENPLIKEWKPRYIINLKDGKSYPVIRITNEPYPRVFRTRYIVEDGSRYFGPFANVHQLDRYLELIEKLYPLRKCRGPIKKRAHPCLYYHIGRCAAACAGKTGKAEYARRIEGITRLLNGDVQELLDNLRKRMERAVSELRFELAADLRDTIAAVESTVQEQQVVDFDPDVRDYIGFYRRDNVVSLTVFHMRGGKMLGSENYHSEVVGAEEEFLPQFLVQYYSETKTSPEKLIVGASSSSVAWRSAWTSSRATTASL